MRQSYEKKYEGLIALIFMLAVCFPPQGGAEGLRADADPNQDNPLASKYGGLHAPLPATQAGSAVPLPYGRVPGSSLVNAVTYQERANEKLAVALIETAERAGSFAKTVTESVSDYIKEKQLEKKRQELVQQFYFNLRQAVLPLELNSSQYSELAARVENVYIRDGEDGDSELDTLSFRDMPVIVRKEYSEMMLDRTKNGSVETYYVNGSVKTRWQIQNGEKHGAAVTYYEDGEILYIDMYDGGRKVNRKKYDPEGKLEFEQNYSYDVPASPSPELGEAAAKAEDSVPEAPVQKAPLALPASDI